MKPNAGNQKCRVCGSEIPQTAELCHICKTYQQRWKAIFHSNLTSIILAFLLTGVAGTFLANRFQTTLWQREKEHTLLTHRLEEKEKLLDQIYTEALECLISLKSQQEALEARNMTAVALERQKFQQIVRSWDGRVVIYRSKLKHLFSRRMADLLIQDQFANPPKQSLQELFLMSRRITSNWRNCEQRGNCSERDQWRQQAIEALAATQVFFELFIDTGSTFGVRSLLLTFGSDDAPQCLISHRRQEYARNEL